MSETKKPRAKISLRDLDWKILVVLLFMMFITPVDDFLLPIIGELLDPVEILANVLLAFGLGRRAMARAAEREGVVVEGKVVDSARSDVRR